MNSDSIKTVDVIIPTYHPDQTLITSIHRLLKQTYPVQKIIIMNTGEEIWKDSLVAQEIELIPQVEVHHVSKAAFDHGKTRDLGIQLATAEFVICMTQDAVPKKNSMVGHLVHGFDDPEVGMAYGAQLPAPDCGVIERYTRGFNYPDYDIVKSQSDLTEMGIKTYFASNVCAAYRKDVYHQLGGFVKKTIFNEDMIFAAGVINNGYKIAYCSKAQVIHSHNYSCIQQFKRNFDMAVSQADRPEIFAKIKSESEGIRLIKKTAGYLIKNRKIRYIPQLVIVSGFKFLGYQLGKRYQRLPEKVVRSCSMNRSYWD